MILPDINLHVVRSFLGLLYVMRPEVSTPIHYTSCWFYILHISVLILHIYIYIYICTHISLHLCVYIYTWIDIHIPVHLCMYIYTHIYTYINNASHLLVGYIPRISYVSIHDTCSSPTAVVLGGQHISFSLVCGQEAFAKVPQSGMERYEPKKETK